MSDITEAPMQQEIADSILDAPIVGSWRDGGMPEEPAEQVNENTERLADLATDRGDEQLSPEETERLAQQVARPGERFGRESERPAEAQEPPQPTPQDVQQSIERLDAFVQQNQLNDPESAKAFATEICEAFGTSSFESPVNVEMLGNVMAKTAYSAAQIYDSFQGDLGQLGPIPPESAKAFTYDFLKSFGADPRTTQVDSQLLAEAVFRGALNFYDSFQRFGGRVTDVAKLNDPAAAEGFLGAFLKAFGMDVPVDRATALRFADAGGKYLLSFMTRVRQNVQQEQARGSRRSGGQRQSRQWKTNSDLFEGAQEMLDQNATGKRGRAGFEPRERAGRSRFQTNQDIFDEDTLRAMNGRL